MKQVIILALMIMSTVQDLKVDAQTGSLRLVNNNGAESTSSGQGRLEVYRRGQWGTICSNQFGSAEATLACNQLGFRTYTTYGTVDSLGYSQATSLTPIWMTNLACNTDSYLTIYKCPWSSYTSGCNHRQDVALSCSSPYSTRPFSIRLVTTNENTSPNLTAGRIDVFFSGKWGSICVDGFSSLDASSVCSTLTGSSTVLRYGRVGSSGLGFSKGPSSSPVWLEDLACSYDYTRRTYNCTHDGLGITDCSHSKDAAVSCLADGAVRLISSSSSYYTRNTSPGGSAGRLEIYHNGQWGTVCNSGFGQNDADVVCRQLGYSRAYRYGSVNNLGYYRGTGTIWLSELGCGFNDIFLANCTHSGFGNVGSCTHYQDAAVSCSQSYSNNNNNNGGGSSVSTGASSGIALSMFAGIVCCICIVVAIACGSKSSSSSRSGSTVVTSTKPTSFEDNYYIVRVRSPKY